MIDLEHAPSYCLFDSKWPLPFRKKGLSIIYVFRFFSFLWIFQGVFFITKYVSHTYGMLYFKVSLLVLVLIHTERFECWPFFISWLIWRTYVVCIFVQIMSENKTEIQFWLLIAAACFVKMTEKTKINMGSNKQSSTANPFLEDYSHNLDPTLLVEVVIKVHIFWEGHNVLQDLHRRFHWHYIEQTYGGDLQNFVDLSEYMNFNCYNLKVCNFGTRLCSFLVKDWL